MATSNDEYVNFDDAITHIMKVTGKSRRQATALLIEKCRQGAVRATGRNIQTGEREEIPKSYFPPVN